MTTKLLVDCHVHLAALPDGDNGCCISPKMLRSPLFRFLLWKHQLSPSNPRKTNRKYLDDLFTELRASRHVQKAVLLGMDGGYNHNGRLTRPTRTFSSATTMCSRPLIGPLNCSPLVAERPFIYWTIELLCSFTCGI